MSALAERDPAALDADVLACSSAGGGLRIAVIGNEELVTAEAGRRVALSSGGKVVAVLPMSDGGKLADLRGAEADIVLLTGGTDGGNTEAVVGGVGSGRPHWARPVVVACNADARDEVAEVLSGTPHVLADNVVPKIGVLAPDSARAAIREMFLCHVIGGKHLSSRRTRAAVLHRPRPRRDARRGAHRRRAARARSRRPAPGRRRRGRRRRRRRDDRRAQRRRARPRGQRARPRGGRHDAGDPHRRGRPRHAVVGGVDGRGRRA